MNINPSGIDAARQFNRLLRSRNPVAYARLAEIIALARQGDLEAIRAIRLLQSAKRSPNVMVGQINNPRPEVTPEQIEMLRQMAVRARNTPYTPRSAGQAPIVSLPPIAPGNVSTQIPGAALGYAGEGVYQIIKPGGLGLHHGPTMNLPAIRQLPFESLVRVIRQGENSWLEINQPEPGFVCLSCAELPGGPWLVRKSV